MKFFWSILVLVVLFAGVYLWLGTSTVSKLFADANSNYNEFLQKISALNNIKQQGLDTLNNVNNFIGTTEEKINSVQNFLATAPKTVSSTISGLYNQIKGQLPPALLNLFAGSSTQALQNFISPSGQFSLATSSVSFQGDVCVEFNNGTNNVDYSIQNPFSPPQDYVYHIDWGDGAVSDGSTKSGGGPLSVTHHYANSGNYQNLFNITSASTTLTAQVRVCIS